MDIYFSDSTGLYFYSALLQANAAIIALIGLYTTFRIQSANSNVESFRNYFLAGNDVLRDLGFRFDEMTLKRKQNNLSLDTSTGIEHRIFQRWYDNLILINKFKIGIILPTTLIAIALISDSIFLFLTTSLHTLDTNIEIKWAVLNLIYQIILVIVISYRVIKLVTLKSSTD